jgi:trans-AT polyketide synthase, acyltransferase and oxidoreductase domains
MHLVRQGADGPVGLGFEGTASPDASAGSFPHLGTLPALYPEWLGDRSFLAAHGVRFPYIAGAMANGIASARMVIAMASQRMLAFFGAGGLDFAEVVRGMDEIQAALGAQDPTGPAWGSNLIFSPNEPELEAAVADLYLERGVRRVSASAYMKLTPAVVRYACAGLTEAPDGEVLRANHLFAKISRPEVARLFMAPAPAAMLSALVEAGQLTAAEAALAARIPLAGDVTLEADSGGHTDNRPLTVLLPVVQALRDEMRASHGFSAPIRVGAAGGLGTPGALAAAFALGADYVLTGTVNQATLEAGISQAAREMLAEADAADVVMAPSPDMFEMGVKVQVLRRGTLFAQRASLLAEVYAGHQSLEELSDELRERLEKEIFQAPLAQIWEQTEAFFNARNPGELERAQAKPRHKMGLVFRWYLGKSSRWAIDGVPERRLDYQIWCGPAMGSFNAWVSDSFLQDPAQRSVVQVALNLLEGAAVITRAQQARSYGVGVPREAFDFRPRPLG